MSIRAAGTPGGALEPEAEEERSGTATESAPVAPAAAGRGAGARGTAAAAPKLSASKAGLALRAPAAPEGAKDGVAARVRALEERARQLAAGGDLEAAQLASQVIKFARKIAEAAEEGDQRDAMLAASRAAAGGKERTTVRLAELVSSARAGLEDLLKSAPNEEERRRVATLIGVYEELDDCLRDLANAIVSNNQARRKMLLPRVAAAAANAKQGVAVAKGAAPAKK